MLQAEAHGVLPPPWAFLFSVYFHDSRVEMVLEPSRIDIRSGSPRHFVGMPHHLISWKYTLNNLVRSDYSKVSDFGFENPDSTSREVWG